MTKLSDLRFRHVNPGRLLCERINPDEPENIPDWFAKASAGALKVEGWVNRSVLVTMETKVQRKPYVAVVSVVGLFATDDQRPPSPDEPDDSVLTKSSSEEIDVFVANAVRDLYPFLRSEMFTLTGRFAGAQGIMLQPAPVLGGPAQPI
ncbi:hypothetical protein [Nocardia alni]|uniref:hypothetical protein n=1 Tax=Nocardia alni TaxID=2815723 RepID=UPI001C218058|nr:hypothetical protein [Nocardia alni]